MKVSYRADFIDLLNIQKAKSNKSSNNQIVTFKLIKFYQNRKY